MYKYIVWTRSNGSSDIKTTKQFKAIFTNLEKELISDRISRGIRARKALKRRRKSEIMEM